MLMIVHQSRYSSVSKLRGYGLDVGILSPA